VHDYARVFGLRTAVLRMSCIYGPRQFGTEDQGWIAHFFLRALRGVPINIYGDGYQVRDALYVEDAVTAWLGVLDRIDAVSGGVFNLGGGPANSISLRELLDTIAKDLRLQPEVVFENARPGDQAWYISDVRKINRTLNWSPRTSLQRGLPALANWLSHRFGSAPIGESLREAMA
jgi:CDP-paratose 2-epimerase